MSIKNLAKSIIHNIAPLDFIRSNMSTEEAENILRAFYPNSNITTCVAQNKLDIKYDLQIIVPAYNVEKFISQCLDSALQQETKYSYILTVVNDGSTDRSLEIIKSYQKKYPNQIEVISQKNRGLSGARNRAMKILQGKYITFLDSDDVLEKGAVEASLRAAFQSNADILQMGWLTSTELDSSKDGIVHHPQALSGYAWGKLYKAQVLAHFQFPEGYWFEDTPISSILFGMKNYKTQVLNELIGYGYRINRNGITVKSRGKRRCLETYHITELCLKEYPKFGVLYDQRAYNHFLSQCLMNQKRLRRLPREIQEAVFVCECKLKVEYFDGMHSQQNRRVERALDEHKFGMFRLLELGRQIA